MTDINLVMPLRPYTCRVCKKKGKTRSKNRMDCDEHTGVVARNRAKARAERKLRGV